VCNLPSLQFDIDVPEDLEILEQHTAGLPWKRRR